MTRWLNVDMDYRTMRGYAKWLSVISAAASFVLIVYLKSHVFENGNDAQMILMISILAAGFSFVFGALSLPKWQGFVALTISGYVIYSVSFTQIYAIP